MQIGCHVSVSLSRAAVAAEAYHHQDFAIVSFTGHIVAPFPPTGGIRTERVELDKLKSVGWLIKKRDFTCDLA